MARTQRLGWAMVGVAWVALLSGCPGMGGAGRGLPSAPLRISEFAEPGDPARRASLRLVAEGLESDEVYQPHRALPRYEQALQVDPNNPYAYLALARHYAERGEGQRSLEFLARAERRFELEPTDVFDASARERLKPHLVGLRGWSERLEGRSGRARVLLRDAARLAPEIWGDGRLSASELR